MFTADIGDPVWVEGAAREKGTTDVQNEYEADEKYVKGIMKEKNLATAAAVFRDVSLAPSLPPEERVLLDALLCYLPTSRKLTPIEELAGFVCCPK